MNIGEELVASYLRHVRGCDFTQQNLYTPDTQGEVDVVGINLKARKIFVCEVAIHLSTGLQYTKGNLPNNVQKLSEKFSRDIEYATKYFPDHERHFMLWSPVVRDTRAGSKYNQMRDIEEIGAVIRHKHGVDIDFVINDRFAACLNEMRKLAASKTEELKCPVMRLMQIEESLSKHLRPNRNNRPAAALGSPA
jgi:hypothetical protein